MGSCFYIMANQFVHLTIQDIIVGILYANCPLLNYLLLIAKLYVWECRTNQIHPSLTAFNAKIKIKYETEKFASVQTGTMDSFNMKWALCSGSIPF